MIWDHWLVCFAEMVGIIALAYLSFTVIIVSSINLALGQTLPYAWMLPLAFWGAWMAFNAGRMWCKREDAR